MKKILKKYIGGVKLIHTYIHTYRAYAYLGERGGCCLKIVTLLSIGKEAWLNSFTSLEVAS